MLLGSGRHRRNALGRREPRTGPMGNQQPDGESDYDRPGGSMLVAWPTWGLVTEYSGLNKSLGRELPALTRATRRAARTVGATARRHAERDPLGPGVYRKKPSARGGPLRVHRKANALWGTHTTWVAEQRPTGFKSWSEVVAFLNRFYQELSQVRSTEGWNVSARGVTSAILWTKPSPRLLVGPGLSANPKIRTPVAPRREARPLLRSVGITTKTSSKQVDVIEPYNSGNNVEVIRSLIGT